MKITVAIEWFLNPDHLPFIIAKEMGIFQKYGIELNLVEPDGHYDGLLELKNRTIEFATNEPLHLIEQFDENIISLGMFFQTKGGVLLKKSSYPKLVNGEKIDVTTPVSNITTDTIAFEILRRYCKKNCFELKKEQINFVPNGFEHIKYMLEGADAGWLYFYNFEGIVAKHEGLDVIYLDSENANFPNFSGLNIFVNRLFYNNNREICDLFTNALKEAISVIKDRPEEAAKEYYKYTNTAKSKLMDEIIEATIECFDSNFNSSYESELPILNFFREIGVTQLTKERFKTSFLS